LKDPFGTIPAPSIIASQFIPSATFFAGLLNLTTNTVTTNPADANLSNVRPIFVNAAGNAA